MAKHHLSDTVHRASSGFPIVGSKAKTSRAVMKPRLLFYKRRASVFPLIDIHTIKSLDEELVLKYAKKWMLWSWMKICR